MEPDILACAALHHWAYSAVMATTPPTSDADALLQRTDGWLRERRDHQGPHGQNDCQQRSARSSAGSSGRIVRDQ